MEENIKRVFFALEVAAPWPEKLPSGRLLDAAHRHMTLAFLGQTDYSKLQESLLRFPFPPFRVGFVGKFHEIVFLPPRHPHVVAWKVQWLDDTLALEPYQKALLAWLLNEGFAPDLQHEKFLPHVTICRSPFNLRQWEKTFRVLPMMSKGLHLYESIGSLRYVPLWSCPLLPPFEELEHTADIAYRIRGENLRQIKDHAYMALAFNCPEMLSFYPENCHPSETIEDIIIELNKTVALLDQHIGSPYKAVSFHGDIKEEEGILTWEMIVDV